MAEHSVIDLEDLPPHPQAIIGFYKNGFQDRNGQSVQAGERIIYTIDGRHGRLDEALHDGDAFVTWDDGQWGTVKWHHLVREQPCPS